MHRTLTRSLLGVALVGGLAAPLILTAAPVVDRSPTTAKPVLLLDDANLVMSAALSRARALNAGGAIAVVDDGGHLIALQRIDGTFAAGAEVSIGKARTAAIFKKPTKAFEDAIREGRVALAAVDAMTPLQGGVPIYIDGQVVGGVGVSGAHSQAEDEAIALAGAAALEPTAAR